MISRSVGPHRHRPVDQLDAASVRALLMTQHTKKVHRFGILGFLLHLPRSSDIKLPPAPGCPPGAATWQPSEHLAWSENSPDSPGLAAMLLRARISESPANFHPRAARLVTRGTDNGSLTRTRSNRRFALSRTAYAVRAGNLRLTVVDQSAISTVLPAAQRH